MLIIGLLKSLLESNEELGVSAILSLDRHLGNIDGLLFDQILLLDIAQAPCFDELVRELSMEEYTALLDASRDP